MQTDRDLIIVGAGAAGLSAAQYGARGNLRTLVLEELASGGQALIIDTLENYPGYPDPVSGFEFSQRMEQQTAKFGAEIMNATVSAVKKENGVFSVSTDRGIMTAQAVILATGAKHRHLGIPGEEEFAGKGVSYCATCDGPFFRGKRMLVVGGGDAACDEATYLSNLASSVLMLHRRDRFRAQKALAERVLKNRKIEARFNTELLEILGNAAVKSVRILDKKSDRTVEESVSAVFIFIGSIPQTALVSGVRLDDGGYIVTDQCMRTSIPGLFAVGDVRSTPFRQLVVAAGEGAIAAHCAAQYIDEARGEAYR
jgi:thioredoxin reductase (NADPH)